MFKTDPAEFPDVLYHTVTIEEDDGEFHIAASSNDHHCIGEVGSVAIGSGEAVGMSDGRLKLDEAGQAMRLEYVDFTDEYGYDEMQITFQNR